MASIFDVPPRRTQPQPVTKINFDPNKPVLTTREYSDLFWYTDAQLTKKDRRDIVSELNQEWVYRVFGSFVGGIGTAIVSKCVFWDARLRKMADAGCSGYCHETVVSGH
jgi:hypothetical protein